MIGASVESGRLQQPVVAGRKDRKGFSFSVGSVIAEKLYIDLKQDLD